jgi:sarcosine/dimethylglycine N-methyltransferase
MKKDQTETQYTTGLSRPNIEQALVAAGFRLDDLQPSDLGPLEDFHTLGRAATRQLADLAVITSHDTVLDAGSGIGGTARFLAQRYGCPVTAVDLTAEYCQTARWLNRLVGLEGRVTVRQGDVTDLPFGDAAFDVVISQHVQMNVADKARLYEQARRVLVPGGRLAIWDVILGPDGVPHFPLPWADYPDRSHLVPADQLRTTIETAGFAVVQWDDLSEQAALLMESFLSAPPGPLGLHLFVENFADKARNLTEGLSSGNLAVIRGIARAAAD